MADMADMAVEEGEGERVLLVGLAEMEEMG
jgi:hypothetical protein